MTPKEKAEELVDKFYQYLPLEKHVITFEGELAWEYNSWGNAKYCALIVVDEILEEYKDDYENLNRDLITIYVWWQEVRKEIEKL